MLHSREQSIIEVIKTKGELSSKEIFDGISLPISYATLKRILTNLVSRKFVETKGRGKGTKYFISPMYELIQPIDVQKYYEKEIDERKIKQKFNSKIITNVLKTHNVFTRNELVKLNDIQKNIKRIYPN